MTEAVLEIRLLEPADWHVLQAARLRALSDSPDAFASGFLAEQACTERQWRRRLEVGSWIVAVEDDEVIGMAGLVGGHPPEGDHVESIWVARSHRRRGVFRALLGALVEIGRRNGDRDLQLWVLEDNVVAQRAYARLGFVPTGEQQPIVPDHPRAELRLRLPL